jgi:hypothetical protein
MNPQDLIRPGEIIINQDPQGNWAMVNSGGQQIMRSRAANGQITEQIVPVQTQQPMMNQPMGQPTTPPAYTPNQGGHRIIPFNDCRGLG